MTHEVANIGEAPVTPSVYLQIVRDGNKPEGESSLYYTYTGPVAYADQEKFKKVEFSAIEKNKAELPKAADNGWVGMLQRCASTPMTVAPIRYEGTPRSASRVIALAASFV